MQLRVADTLDLRIRLELGATNETVTVTGGTPLLETSTSTPGTVLDERRLLENYAAVIEEVIRAKPSAAKGRYIRSVTLASTMSPGVKVDPSRTRDIVEEAVPA